MLHHQDRPRANNDANALFGKLDKAYEAGDQAQAQAIVDRLYALFDHQVGSGAAPP